MNDLTLSIVSHGHGELLHRVLSDLDALPGMAGTPVVVTLNLDGEPFDASRYRTLRVEVVRNRSPRGFGANHNEAFRRCETPWFGVLNPDLRFAHGDPFATLLGEARRVGDVGAIAPRIVDSRGSPEDSVRSNLTPWSLLARHVGGSRRPADVRVPARRGSPFYWLAGMCIVLSAEAFRVVGGFDERFFLYCEDYDLCARLYDAGYALVVEPNAAVTHDAQRDSHRSPRHLAWHLQSLAKVWLSRAYWALALPRRARPRG